MKGNSLPQRLRVGEMVFVQIQREGVVDSIHRTADELSRPFGLAPATASAKAAEIRRLVRLSPLDAQWLLPELIEDSPALWMISWNGFIVDARDLPPEIQREAAGMGLIPYAPAMKGAADGEEPAQPKKGPAAQNPPRVNASASNASHMSENSEPSSAPNIPDDFSDIYDRFRTV